MRSEPSVNSAEARSTMLSATMVLTLVVFGSLTALILWTGRRDYADLHIMLDTGMFLLPGVLAMLFWDMGTRIESPFPKLLAVSFGFTSVLAFVHALVGIEWPIAFASVNQAENILRPTTWPPPAHSLPIAIGSAIWLRRRGTKSVWLQALLLALITPLLFVVFRRLPLYTASSLLGITRPVLITAPFLCAAVGWTAWRLRASERLMAPLTFMSALLFTANIFMLYSRQPHDSLAIVAHLGVVCGYLLLLLAVMLMASTDMQERVRAERELAQLNQELEARVLRRTEELNATNQSLAAEIRERRRTEAALRESQARLESTLEGGGIGTWIFDIASNQAWLDDSLLKILGRSRKELDHPEGFYRFVHPDDRERAQRTFQSALREGRDHQSEFRYVRPDGKVIWLESRGRPDKNADEEPLRMIGCILDVTERKQAEEVQLRLAAIVESSDDAIISKTLDGIITSWNRGAENIFGYSAQETMGQPMMMIIPPELADEEREILRKIARGEAVSHFETVRITKSGARIDVSSTISPIRDPAGKIIGASKIAHNITNQKLAEAALRESESRKEAILRTALDCVITMDRAGNIIEFNPAAENTFGYARHEVIGKSMADLIIPPHLRGAHHAGFEKYLSTGEAPILGKRIEITAVRANGEEFPVELAVTVVQGRSGPTFTGFVRDITERQQAIATLHELNEKLETFIQASPLAIVALNLERKVTLWNRAAERLFGWSAAEVMGHVVPTIPEEDLSNQLALREEFLRNDTVVSDLETRRSRKDGSIIPVSASFAPLRDTHGVITGTIGIIADITERKQAEEQLRLQTAALESAANAIVITDVKGQIIWINPAFIKSTGYGAEEVIGQNPRLLKSGKQQQEFYRDMWDTILSGKVWRNTLINKRKDGTLNHEDMTITPIRNKSGEITHFVAIKQDITELQQALSELEQKNDALAITTQQLWQASKLATMGELAASVAHELNNPLATVSLHAETLVAEPGQSERARKSAQVVLQEIERMADLVNNLLQFSRRGHRQISTVDAAEEISNSVNFIGYYLRNRNITVVTEFGVDLPTVQADRQQLRQLFLNLLTNASDAMAGRGTLIIRTSTGVLRGGEALVVEFIDSGVGIPPANLERIWDSFFTTKPEGKGTGLGLAICRRIVEEHRGTISIASKLDRGTTVQIILPATANGAALITPEMIVSP